MKLSFLAAAALAAAATFIPTPAQANETIIGITACSHVKAGMPAPRAVQLAANSNPQYMAQIRATGASSSEAAQMIFGVMQTMCGEYLRSSTTAKPQISKEEMAKIRARERSQQLIANRKECSEKVSAAPRADRLRVLMSECR